MAVSLGRFRLRLSRERGDRHDRRSLTTVTGQPPDFGASPRLHPPVNASNALSVADAYACVRALSDAAASLPLLAYRRRQDGSRERYTGRLAELLERPAPATTRANLIGQLVAHLNLWGNAYLAKLRGPDGRIDRLALLDPGRVRVEIVRGQPEYTFTDAQGQRSEHGPDEILHVRAMSTDGVYGLSPVSQCRLALGLSSNLTEHAARFFLNDATPAGVLRVPADTGEEEIDKIGSAWSGHHRGVSRSHRIAVMTGDVSFDRIAMRLDDAQFLEQRQLSATEIARIFRVPPWVIGAQTGDSMTYSNVAEQKRAFLEFSVTPWLVLIEQALTNDRDLSPRRVYAEFLLDAALRPDAATRASIYSAALNPQTGWMTRAEVRELENLAPERSPQ